MVKSCQKLESGLRVGPEGVCACCLGVIQSPLYWTPEEAATMTITKEMIMEKRKWLFNQLNDPNSDIACKRCKEVYSKPIEQVAFHKIGHVNIAHFTYCQLRCCYCSYTVHDTWFAPMYEVLPILKQFGPQDADHAGGCWVDINGGEPTLLPNVGEFVDYFRSIGSSISFFTNGVRFSQPVYDGLLDGTMAQVIVSLDAGTPATFLKMKARNHYYDVVSNLTQYAKASNSGKGKLVVKYIFHDLNCGDDDIDGFICEMVDIKPKEVWLMVDFFPIGDCYPGQEKMGVYDFSRHIQAYAKMWVKAKKAGVDVRHFLIQECGGSNVPEQKAIMNAVLEAIKLIS